MTLEDTKKEILEYFKVDHDTYIKALANKFGVCETRPKELSLYFAKELITLEGNDLHLFFINENLRLKFYIKWLEVADTMIINTTLIFPLRSGDIKLYLERHLSYVSQLYFSLIRIDIDSMFNRMRDTYIKGYMEEGEIV